MRRPLFSVALLALAALGCPTPPPPPPPPDSGRCEVDLEALAQFSRVGTTASARVIAGPDDLVGGNWAMGVAGDFVLENDRLRVVIQRPLRTIAPGAYGGTIIDADVKRAAGEPGRDQLGKLSPIYGFGRTIRVDKVEVLKDGSSGGYAVVAASGDDELLDYVNVQTVLGSYVPGAHLVKSPDEPLTLRMTTYFVLSPGESRVRTLTAFCNTGHDNIVTTVGDVIEQGGESDFFNPSGCTNGLGSKGCIIDPMGWMGYQADGVAYGYRAWRFSDLSAPSTSALLSVVGIEATMVDAESMQGVLTWMDSAAPRRPGAFGILAADQRLLLRDFYVARDVSEISSAILNLATGPRARLEVTTQNPDGTAAPNARVAIADGASGVMATLLVTDASGHGRVDLAPGPYEVSAGAVGHALTAPTQLTLAAGATSTATLTLGTARTLHVSVRDPAGLPLTAKVTVLCEGGPCPSPMSAWKQYEDIEKLPDELAASGFVGASGDLDVSLPPGLYRAFITRGPEYSAWPDTFPTVGAVVDTRTQDASVSATLAQVVDTTGWMSADLHVHAVGSADSKVANATRVLSFAAEGVDVMVSTDHDFVTDYAPVVRDLGLASVMASLIGVEVTPFDYGHQNAWPVTKGEGPTGGAFDWAGGDGPALRLPEIFSGLRALWPEAVLQMNHPRGGSGGSLNQLLVDTATGASHADAATFRQAPSPDATALDSHLFSLDFEAFEVMNGFNANTAALNDWMTFLSRGWVKTATGVSDTHTVRTDAGGYGRTWLRLGVDSPAQFTNAAFAEAVRQHRAVAGSGPFITMTARRLDNLGQPQGSVANIGDTVSVAPSAGDQVELTVDVQAPEWMQFDAVELYAHAPGREAVNGVPNSTWPTGRILVSRPQTPTALPLEAVPGSFSARRVHVVERFVVTPTADNWYVAMVRSSNVSRGAFPLAFGVSCSGGVCTATSPHLESLTNPIFVDADGSGAYDDFPLKPAQPLTAPPPPPSPAPRVPSLAEFAAGVRAALRADHGRP